VAADNRSVGVCARFVTLGVALALSCAGTASAYTPGPSCGEKTYLSPTGVGFRILFANNGAVQQYVVTAKADNPEAVNDARNSLEATYGPAGINAPALKIVSFRPGENGMQVPDKAIDSCGRTLSFN
jgi:hypothetical protein